MKGALTTQHSIENEFLTVTADDHGAELVSVVDKKTGAEMMWQADPSVWDRHAPILFPYCGKLKHGTYTLDGQTYSGVMHGFARDMDHEFLGTEGQTMRFVLNSDEKTLDLLPREFALESTFSLEGRCLRQNIRVINQDSRELRFGMGFHPAFTFPFDERHTTKDYEIRFDSPQTPVVLDNIQSGPDLGFVSGESYLLAENSFSVPLHDRMFDQDSICMSGLTSRTLSILEKDSGRNISLRIDEFPYILLWSMLGTDVLKFLCIEPWHSLQDAVDATGDWNKKPCAAVLAPGESWQTDLDITYNWS